MGTWGSGRIDGSKWGNQDARWIMDVFSINRYTVESISRFDPVPTM